MQFITKQIVKYSGIEAVSYAIVCPLLFLLTAKFAGREAALAQMLTLIIASTIFFAYSLLSFTLYRYLWLKRRKGLIGYYLGSKVLGVLVAIFALIMYALIGGAGVAIFALHIFSLYLVYLVVTTLMYTSIERKLKQLS